MLTHTLSPFTQNKDLQIERLLLRPSIPIDSVGNSDDTTALYINPAGLSIHPLQIGYFYGNNVDKGIEDHTIFLNLFGISFSTQWRFAPNSQSLRRYTLGTGLGSTELLSLGFSFSWFDSTDANLNNYNSLDFGLILRPHRSVSLGLVGRNLTESKIQNLDLRHRWDCGFSLRPLGYFLLNDYYENLTLSVEVTWVVGQHIRTLIPRYMMEFIFWEGIDLYTGLDHEENFFVGLKFSSNFYRLSIQGSIPGVSEEISQILLNTQNDEGNSFNVGLFVGQERLKSHFEAISYILEISLDEIPTNETAQEVFLPFAKKKLLFYDILRSIKIAQKDPQINGILIKGRKFSGGWAQAEELRNALLDFKKKSSKPVIAFMEKMHNREYYIASVADEISMPPAGSLLLNGLKAELIFIKDLLNKIGVEADFIQIGDYKTAPDIFKRNSPSSQAKEQITKILKDISQELHRAIRISRHKKIDVAMIDKIIDHGLYNVHEAQLVGLIDREEYSSSLIRRFKAQQGSIFLSEQAIQDYARVTFYDDSWGPKPRIAIVVIEGNILEQKSTKSLLMNKATYSDKIVKLIKTLRMSVSVKGIIIRVNSPGGSALASDLIWKEISLAKEAGKPIIVSLGDIAASGGYYVSMGGDQILTNKNSITGSIGVFSGKFSLKKLYEKLGVQKTVYTTSKHAAIFSEVDTFTDSERALLKENLKGFYKLFVQRVNKNRKEIDLKQVEQNAGGRVYTGKDALKRKMVDQIGGLQTAIHILKQTLKINRDYVNINIYPQKTADLFHELGVTQKLILPYLVKKSVQIFDKSEQLEEDQIHFLLPYQIEIE